MAIKNHIFFGLLILYFVEQIMYWFTGSFIYRYGFLIRTVPMPGNTMSDWASIGQKKVGLSIKLDDGKKEVYLRYRYPSIVLGPLLFVGQIIFDKSAVLKIRVGYFSSIFIVYILFYQLLTGGVYQALNSLIVLAIISVLYIRFQNSYKRVINLRI